MKTLLTRFCLIFAVLLGSVGVSWSADFGSANPFINSFCKVQFLCFQNDPNWLGWITLVVFGLVIILVLCALIEPVFEIIGGFLENIFLLIWLLTWGIPKFLLWTLPKWFLTTVKNKKWSIQNQKRDNVSEIPDGPWFLYYGNNILKSKEYYKNNKLNGDCVYYREDGTVISTISGTFKDGVKVSD
jgi:hypothetical protein